MLRKLTVGELEIVTGGNAGYDSADDASATGVNVPLTPEQRAEFAEFLAASFAADLANNSNANVSVEGSGDQQSVEVDMDYDGISDASLTFDNSTGNTIVVTASSNLSALDLVSLQDSIYDTAQMHTEYDWDLRINPENDPGRDTDGDGVADVDDADPNNPNIQNEIVVNGVRVDEASREEIMHERDYYIRTGGAWGNAELVRYEDGSAEWLVTGADAPTADQLLFAENFDAINSALAVFNHDPAKDHIPATLASAFTDAGISVVGAGLDVLQLFSQYQGLLNTGQQTGRTAADFVSWVASSQLNMGVNITSIGTNNTWIFDAPSSSDWAYNDPTDPNPYTNPYGGERTYIP